jgi:hypothetical protein
MTPESRDSPLLDNGSLKHVSATTDKSRIIELLEVITSIRFGLKL